MKVVGSSGGRGGQQKGRERRKGRGKEGRGGGGEKVGLGVVVKGDI